jgi:UDP-N-acetylglucosamine transferase subunit ALG13
VNEREPTPAMRPSTPAAPGLDVLVVVGTDTHPFDRLIGWIDTWASTRPGMRALQQIGSSLVPAHTAWVRLLAVPELHAHLDASTLVVTHGGPGTISDAVAHGRRPIVVPRDPAHGEHVDDHQLRFAREVAARASAFVATTETALRDHLDAGLATPERYRCSALAHDAGPAIDRFGALIRTLEPRPHRARRPGTIPLRRR